MNNYDSTNWGLTFFFYFFQEKDALIRSYERQLRQKDEEIVSKEKKLQQLSLQLKENEEEPSRKEKEIASKEEKLQQLSHQLSKTDQELRRVKVLMDPPKKHADRESLAQLKLFNETSLDL